MQDDFNHGQLAHVRSDSEWTSPREPSRLVLPADVDRMVAAALSSDDESVDARANALLREGVTLRQLYQEVITPAAQELGRRWEEDHSDFVEVTIGAGRLQRLIRELGRSRPPTPSSSDKLLVVLGSQDSETHTLGIAMVADCFLMDGWHVEMAAPLGSASLLEAVQTHEAAVVGLCVTSLDEADAIAPLVAAVRRKSRNPDVLVLVGGRAFVERPELVAMSGADAFTPDAVGAPSVASALVRARRRPHLYVSPNQS
jgi:MerR family transcriptional regulator, light-induced transcriptional regulator